MRLSATDAFAISDIALQSRQSADDKATLPLKRKP